MLDPRAEPRLCPSLHGVTGIGGALDPGALAVASFRAIEPAVPLRIVDRPNFV